MPSKFFGTINYLIVFIDTISQQKHLTRFLNRYIHSYNYQDFLTIKASQIRSQSSKKLARENIAVNLYRSMFG